MGWKQVVTGSWVADCARSGRVRAWCRHARAAGWLAATLGCAPAWAERPDVVIDPGGVTPEALTVIHGAVEAITRLAEDQDGGEVSRLRRRAHDATVSALATQGYFAPTVTLEVGEDIGGETWDIIIEPGERTVVADVNLHFRGQITLPEFSARVERLREQWPLRRDMPFINQAWSDAKSELLDATRRRDFYFARLGHTQATVDPDVARADLYAEVRSGPRVRMGELMVSGLKRVPRSLVERYVRYDPLAPYDQDRLDDWQQALQSTEFFRGAFVTMETDDASQRALPGDEIALPVHVRITEAPAQRVTASLGADSDHGVRVEGLYRQNVVFGLPVSIETGAGVDKDQQRAFFDVHLPPTVSGYRDSVGVLYEHSDLHQLERTRLGLGWRRNQARHAAGDSRVEYETEWYALAAQDRHRVGLGPWQEVPTLVGTWQWLRRDVNDKYDPREGNLIVVGLGAGLTLDRRQPFYRLGVRMQQWWPVGERDVLTVRGEVGKVWSQAGERLPADFGYRTGGARSIRGYRYLGIGERRGDAIVGAHTLAVASIEYNHFFTDMLGMSVFVDVGDAAPSFADMRPAVGVGVGAVVRTPAGPFSVDLAWGHRDRRLRLGFSMGIAF